MKVGQLQAAEENAILSLLFLLKIIPQYTQY